MAAGKTTGPIARRVMSLLVWLAAVYAAGLAGLLLVEDRLVFFPDRTLYETPANYGLAFEDVHVTAADGVRLHGWWIPARRPRASLLFCHGNAGNIADRADNAARLVRLGINVLLFDYRGYGRSDGTPSERGIYLDAQAMLEWMRLRKDVDPERIVYFGRSLGGAAAIDLATRRAPRALIVESAFASIRAVAASLFPYCLWTPFIPRHYDNVSKIRSLKCPLLVLHGRKDEVIPFSQGWALYSAAQGPKRFLDKGGGHNDLYGSDPRAYLAAIDSFLGQHAGTGAKPDPEEPSTPKPANGEPSPR